MKKVQKVEVKYHGKFCDRHVQTEKDQRFELFNKLNKDKFKRFFFAVFYTYMMMNTIMADALPYNNKQNQKK